MGCIINANPPALPKLFFIEQGIKVVIALMVMENREDKSEQGQENQAKRTFLVKAFDQVSVRAPVQALNAVSFVSGFVFMQNIVEFISVLCSSGFIFYFFGSKARQEEAEAHEAFHAADEFLHTSP